jgi:group II intron reverse transcriptase/maturase
MARISSLSEKPISDKPRRLADWLNPTGEKKVHSLIDKVYKQKNLELAWDKVKCNKGAGGIDGQSITEFEKNSEEYLARLHDELRTKTYQPKPVKQQLIPKNGQPGKYRPLGIPTVYDRICQQALLNRLEPIFEPIFDDANFGYRRGRSTKDAMRKIWKEIEAGNEWIVDADLKDFFGSACQQKLLTLFRQRIADGRILNLLDSIMKAGCIAEGKKLPSERGVPQVGVFSPLASNVLLTPFDREMRRKGYRLTRYADDCVPRTQAKAA